jgi:hypothetical protein
VIFDSIFRNSFSIFNERFVVEFSIRVDARLDEEKAKRKRFVTSNESSSTNSIHWGSFSVTEVSKIFDFFWRNSIVELLL